MKKYILLLPAVLAGFALTAQESGKQGTGACNGCAAQLPQTISQYLVMSDGEKHVMTSGCIPGSDIEVYSDLSGGRLVSYAVANEKGVAEFILPEKMPTAFIINHNRVNAAGIAGSGHVSFIANAVAELNDFEVNASGTYVQLACKAAAGISGLQLVMERSNGLEKAVVFSQALTPGSAPLLMPALDNVKGIAQGGVVTYTVKIVNGDGVVLFAKNKAVAVPQSSWADVVPTAFTGSVTVRVPADKLPADYTVFDLSGKKVLQRGKITSQNQQVQVNVNPGQYLMQVNDGKGNVSTEKIIRQ